MADSLLLVGCGKMGRALLGGWLDQGVRADHITVVEPNREAAKAAADRYAVNTFAGAEDLDAGLMPETVVFAVKPQVMDAVVPAYAKFSGPDTQFLSIAAGKTIAYFEEKLGGAAAVIRAMPNTPAAVRRGITVVCANANTSDDGKRRSGELLEAVGDVAWIDDEALMDAVTAVSGSGPAYVFLLAECLAEAGMSQGLPSELAQQLARATVSGAGELLRQSPEEAGQLRENVTSPGGTTAAALEILMAGDGFPALLEKAVAEATKRSRQLAD